MSTPPFLTLPVTARAVRLSTRRGGFAALEALPDRPPRGTALLVPGFTGSKEDFIGLLEPLTAAGFRVVAVDQRGQYETGGPPDERAYALTELGRDVLALARAVGDGAGPVHLLGHSFGGFVVREAVTRATACPAGDGPRWRSLTLLSSGPAAIEPREAARLRVLLDALRRSDLETIWQVMRAQEEAGAEPGRPVPPEVADFLHRRWLANVPQALAAMARHLVEETDRLDGLRSAGLPTLVMSGVRDYAWPVHWQDAMAERLGAHRVVVGGAGHSPNAECPAETADALVRFWSAAD